jgi:hypothetical protein
VRHFKLAFVVFVLFSTAGLAQHNAGGGGGSSSGGSHGGGSSSAGGSFPSSSGGGSSYNAGSPTAVPQVEAVPLQGPRVTVPVDLLRMVQVVIHRIIRAATHRAIPTQVRLRHTAAGSQATPSSASRFALDQQLQQVRAAESARDSACSAGASQECSDLSLKANSGSNLYRSLSERYRQCRQGQWQNYPMTPLPNSTSDPMLTGLDDH